MKTTASILIALAWRILIAVSTCTFFQPDEFFQSLEVAHRAVFGYGHLTWEWTTSLPIRSVFFPALYMPAYWTLKVSGWDNGDALIIAPKVLQGVIAAITDISTRELAKQLLGERYAETAFVLSLASFFHILALGRTLSNSVETSLTTAALCFWPWNSTVTYRRLQLAFALAATSCLVRPTSVVIWTFLFLELCWRARSNKGFIRMLFVVCLATALFVAGFLVYIDSLYFGKLSFTPLNFVLVNLSSVSLFYGQAPWHYYLTQGLPVILNVCLPHFVFAGWDVSRRGFRHQKTLLASIIWSIVVYSRLGHKEWRFLHPLLPLMLVLSAKSLVESRRMVSQQTAATPSEKGRSIRLTLLAICALGILPGLYVMRWHGSAQISVLSYLRSVDSSTLRSVGFLMPCHSTPWQAYLHKPELSEGRLWALSCEPPLDRLDIATYVDQTGIFYTSPLQYLKKNFPSVVDPEFPPSPSPSVTSMWEHSWPSHLVFFGALLEDIRDGGKIKRYLQKLGYSEVWSGRNGFEEDWRRRGGVKVWRWQGTRDFVVNAIPVLAEVDR